MILKITDLPPFKGQNNSDINSKQIIHMSFIASPIKACQKDEGREEIYQGRKPQEYWRISRFSDTEKFSIWQVLLARLS